MANKDIFGFDEDFSHINSIEDLNSEIVRLRLQIEKDNQDIKESFAQVPKEAIRATVGTIAPLFLKARVADTTWRVIQTAASFLVANPFKKGDNAANPLINVAKQAGFFAAITGIKKMFSKKKKNKIREDEIIS